MGQGECWWRVPNKDEVFLLLLVELGYAMGAQKVTRLDFSLQKLLVICVLLDTQVKTSSTEVPKLIFMSKDSPIIALLTRTGSMGDQEGL